VLLSSVGWTFGRWRDVARIDYLPPPRNIEVGRFQLVEDHLRVAGFEHHFAPPTSDEVGRRDSTVSYQTADWC
jgi:hypothetical protein